MVAAALPLAGVGDGAQHGATLRDELRQLRDEEQEESVALDAGVRQGAACVAVVGEPAVSNDNDIFEPDDENDLVRVLLVIACGVLLYHVIRWWQL